MLLRSVPNLAMRTGAALGCVLASEETVAEMRTVLIRSKFDRDLSPADRTRVLDEFLATIEMVAVGESIHDCRDPQDNKSLEPAILGGATHLVTGEDDLLVFHLFRGVGIVTPQVLLDEFALDSAGELKL